jgi:hypothetical protein
MNTINAGVAPMAGAVGHMINTPASSPCPAATNKIDVLSGSASVKSARQASKRLAREWRTIETMVRIYCRDRHDGGLCPECKGLLDYASVRLERCRFGTEKPTCAKCPVHCYQKNRREQVRAVMRYAGPRMLLEHPILSLWHWVDGRRRVE